LTAIVDFGKSFNDIERVSALYNTTPDDAEWIASQLQGLAANHELPIDQFSPVLGAHVGPGALGLAVQERRLLT
jgi:fatty acid-binding protein DegV